VGGIFGEAREALIGGCWGLYLSVGFLLFSFVTGLAMIFRVTNTKYEINLLAISLLFVCISDVSAILSPFVGALFGAQSGMYSVVRHIGCFVLYIIALIGAMIAAIIYL